MTIPAAPTEACHPPGCHALRWWGREWLVDPDRGLVLPARRLVIITDPHFGKEASFQSAGLPVPDGGLKADLARLSAMVQRHEAGHLLILGDFFHNRSSRSTGVERDLRQWRERHPGLRITLVRGNHDRHAGDPADALEIQCLNGPMEIEGIVATHDAESEIAPPNPSVNGHAAPPMLSGHVHPAVQLKDRAGRGLRLPCFHFDHNGRARLPSFGSFTGSHIIKPQMGDRVVAVHHSAVVEIPVG